MKTRFFNGLFLGALIGAVIGIFINPQLDPQQQAKANKFSNDVKRQAQNLIDRTLKDKK